MRMGETGRTYTPSFLTISFPLPSLALILSVLPPAVDKVGRDERIEWDESG